MGHSSTDSSTDGKAAIRWALPSLNGRRVLGGRVMKVRLSRTANFSTVLVAEY